MQRRAFSGAVDSLSITHPIRCPSDFQLCPRLPVHSILVKKYAVRDQIVMNIRFLASLAPFALLCSVSFAAGPTDMPKEFTTVIGGFLGSTYAVELRDGALRYTEKKAANGRYEVTSSATVTPTPEQWQEFRKSIDQLNIWRWHTEYPSRGTQDGTHWSLEIAYADRALKTHGDNNYPDVTGRPNDNPDTTETFNRYLAAVRTLIGGRHFE
jgi:hypothetical protein